MTERIAEMRALARKLYDAAVRAADPALAVRRHFQSHPPAAPAAGGQTILIAIGKAAPAMLAEAMVHVPGPVTALAVTHYGNGREIPGARVLTASHPEPDEAGLQAGRDIIALLDRAGPQDRVIALISGGGSALVPAPLPPLTLADKQQVNRLLLASGLEIGQVNLIRQQLSDLKGGGFLRHAAPAPVTALILSDVIGNDLGAIASGPTVAPLGTRREALELLAGRNLLEKLPAKVRELLESDAAPAALPKAENHLIGSNEISLDAMRAAVPEGWTARIVSDRLTGDVAEAAAYIAETAGARRPDRPEALIFGGETTVALRGTGKGGRNQELALRIALMGRGWPGYWAFLSGGTDGRDGPTDAAGGIVDGSTAERIRAAGRDGAALLANNDSHAALQAAGDLLLTGATGTNVADVQVLLLS
ncbi:glycerate kinase type-2 family protein [Paracoccus simplex]|uniref:Glycerate kinase n=1 Tax=Paracoccus simplex TaxID=2086346 RepID=A0ABV7S4E1_9RHOB